MIHVYSIAVARHALTHRSKGQRSHGYETRHGRTVASDHVPYSHTHTPLCYLRQLPEWVCMSIRLPMCSSFPCISDKCVASHSHKGTVSLTTILVVHVEQSAAMFVCLCVRSISLEWNNLWLRDLVSTLTHSSWPTSEGQGHRRKMLPNGRCNLEWECSTYLPNRRWWKVMFSPTSVRSSVCEHLPDANSSPMVTKFRQSSRWPQGTRWLNLGRSRSVGEVCTLLSPSNFYCNFGKPVTDHNDITF